MPLRHFLRLAGTSSPETWGGYRMITLDGYQRQAVDWLNDHEGIGLIHAAAGTGKTFIAAAFCKERDLKRVLVLCPATLKQEWKKELWKFDEIVPKVIEGAASLRGEQWVQPYRFTVANYELLITDYEHIKKEKWDAIICDESHYVNSPVAKRTKALKSLAAPIRIALSGDPFPNGELAEAFSLTDWFHPGILGKNFYHFRSRFCRLHPVFRQKIIGYNNKAELEKIVNRFIYVIPKSVLTALPPKKERIIYVTLEEKERKMYYELEHLLRIEVEGKRRLTVPNLLALLMRLRQFIDQPEIFDSSLCSSKRSVLSTVLSELSQKNDSGKTIVFTEFATLAHNLAEEFGAALISGDLPQAERTKQIERFRNDPACKLLVSTAAGGYGLNLTCAKRIIHYGIPWNYARINQRVSRAWRRGQDEEVEEIFLLAEKTIDEKMWKLVQKKKDNAEMIVRDKRKELRNIMLEDYDDET